MSNIVISDPVESDITTMVSWGKENRALWASETGSWYTPETIRKWIEDPGKDIMLVARVRDTLVGMCLVHAMRDWAYCSALFVDHRYRGKSAGTMLLRAAEEKLVEKGIFSLGLIIEDVNDRSIQFYLKQGFQKGFHFRWMGKSLKKK